MTLSLLLAIALAVRAADETASPTALPPAGTDFPPPYVDVELVDVPTGYAQAHRSVAFNLRLYEGASFFGRATIGLFDRATLGVSWEVQNVIGSGTMRGAAQPQPYLKLTLLEEKGARPAVALGYSLQGYGPHGAGLQGDFADDPLAEDYNLYFAKPRGFFLATSLETERLLILQWTFGVNALRLVDYLFDHDFGLFAGVAAGLTPDLYLCAEYDDALNRRGGNWNVGINYHLGRGWRLELALKNLFKPNAGWVSVPRSASGAGAVLSRMVKLDVLWGF